MSTTENCAHRGASSQAPENTVAALELAIRLGATMAEIDIQQTADDHLVLFHDDALGRTSNGSGLLWEQKLSQLKKLDAGSWFSEEFQSERIPELAEAVEAVRGRLKLNIELKMHGHERELPSLVAAELKGLDCLEWCLVSSFDHAAVDHLGKLLPDLKTGYIVGRGNWNDDLLVRSTEVLSLEKSMITPNLVRKIHSATKEVHVWTVNETADIQQMRDLKVDAVISNYPHRVSEILF